MLVLTVLIYAMSLRDCTVATISVLSAMNLLGSLRALCVRKMSYQLLSNHF
jgi:hypothetical protein